MLLTCADTVVGGAEDPEGVRQAARLERKRLKREEKEKRRQEKRKMRALLTVDIREEGQSVHISSSRSQY